jgi:general secretion pathway protein C
MAFLFCRQEWVVDLVAIAVTATLTGHSAATLIASALPPRLPTMPPHLQLSAPVSVAPGAEGIVGRHIFYSTRADAPPDESTRRALTLLAIMFAPPPSDPRWSVAVVRDDEAATAGPFGVGARLGDATIVAIEPTCVVLDRGRGRRELLELFRGRIGVVPAPGRGPMSTFAEAVTKTGGQSYEVQRSALEQLLAGGLSSWPRVVPDLKDGEPGGLRLVGIRTDSPFAAIGLADGDRLLEVNGRSMLTPDAALAAYASLRTTSHVWLMIERGGHRVRMDYVIR